MWKQPQYNELDAPQDMKELMHNSIYYNSEGNLEGADLSEVIEVGFMFVISWVAVSLILSFLLSLLLPDPIFWQIGAIVVSFGVICVIFYQWGWNKYEEAWYHFDKNHEILTVISRNDKSWETVEIPFEAVNRVVWTGRENGRAIIHAGNFKYATNRAGTKRQSSVTEIWNKLARLDSEMIGWPIDLTCPECKRKFGHHIGTAQCPFDDVILIDPNVKGRIDPKEQHPDDFDRI